MGAADQVHTLTFDVFGTIMDLGTSHAPRLREYVRSKGIEMGSEELWERWRHRQRIEQFQDTLFNTGHYGYLDSSRRALKYTLRAASLPFDDTDVRHIMSGWDELVPFSDVLNGLERLRSRFKLVVLSNGNRDYLVRIIRDCLKFDFDVSLSVDEVCVFKPDPVVYRYAARILESEPSELMMVSAHSFDAIGARASGYRAAYVNRYDLPYEESRYQPDIVAFDFLELAERLGCT